MPISSAQWARLHQQYVELNEATIVHIAASLQAGRLRSGQRRLGRPNGVLSTQQRRRRYLTAARAAAIQAPRFAIRPIIQTATALAEAFINHGTTAIITAANTLAAASASAVEETIPETTASLIDDGGNHLFGAATEGPDFDDENDDNVGGINLMDARPKTPENPPHTTCSFGTPGVGDFTPGSTAPPTPLAAFTPGSRAAYDSAQINDVVKRPWNWTYDGSQERSAPRPTAVGKWWSMTQAVFDDPNTKAHIKRNFGHIGRIMETDIGEQRTGNEACDRCRQKGFECWVYREDALPQIWKPGSACARCRATIVKKGCSISTRKPQEKKGPPLGGAGGGLQSLLPGPGPSIGSASGTTMA
jgi:hypothetical protein